jgi:hypothetical protein
VGSRGCGNAACTAPVMAPGEEGSNGNGKEIDKNGRDDKR